MTVDQWFAFFGLLLALIAHGTIIAATIVRALWKMDKRLVALETWRDLASTGKAVAIMPREHRERMTGHVS